MKFAKIFLVRHGGIVNKKNIIYGYLPLPLSATGQKEVKKTGLFLRNKNIAAIFASPIRRTQQSAKILAQVISKGKIKIQTEKDLRESGWGQFLKGLAWEQAKKKYPKQAFLYWRKPAKVTSGESLQKMAARMLKVVQTGIKKYPGRNFVLVSHRDPILALLLRISKRDFNDLHRVQHFCGTGSVLEVDLIGKKLINKNF